MATYKNGVLVPTYTDAEAVVAVKASVKLNELQAPTGAVVLNSQKITGLAAAAAAGDAVAADANVRAPDATKLEGSSKATVQSHTPAAHESTHVSGGSDDIDSALADSAIPTFNEYSILRTGLYFNSYPAAGSTDTKSLTDDDLLGFPLPIPRALTIDRLAIHVTTAAGGETGRLGIYNNGDNVYPGSLLLDAGEVDVGTTGIKEIIINQSLSKGLYWLGLLFSANVTLRIQLRYFSPIGKYSTDFGSVCNYWHKAQAYGVLPNPFPAGGTYTGITGRAYSLAHCRLASLD